MKIQYRCLNDKCGIIISTAINRDGIRCHLCDGPVMPQPFEPKERHIPYKPKPKSILMGSENHNGWKLEELLNQVKLEVSLKLNKIIDDPSPQAQLVVRNNLAIIEHLGAAEALQRSSYVVLDSIRKNEGPSGKPRIGG